MWLYEILGGILQLCQNATVRVCGAWIKIYYVLYSKTYNTRGGLFWTPAGSRRVARICETRLLHGYWKARFTFTSSVTCDTNIKLICGLGENGLCRHDSATTHGYTNRYGEINIPNHQFNSHASLFPHYIKQQVLPFQQFGQIWYFGILWKTNDMANLNIRGDIRGTF